MISAVAAAGPVEAAAVLGSVVATAVGKGKTATDVDVATNAKQTQITLIFLTLTGISLRTSGNAFI
jgi:tRNA nucleotidyltransferase/poly(A) polymerase